eukprot:scaffold104837_cov24-Tisochrysis_lutea.AAC.1
MLEDLISYKSCAYVGQSRSLHTQHHCPAHHTYRAACNVAHAQGICGTDGTDGKGAVRCTWPAPYTEHQHLVRAQLLRGGHQRPPGPGKQRDRWQNFCSRYLPERVRGRASNANKRGGLAFDNER